MLKIMTGNEATGIYSAAHTCAVMTSFIFAAIIDSMRPVIFEYRKKDDQLFKKSLVGLYSVIIYFSLAQCVVMTVFSSFIVRIMFGLDYQDAAIVLRISVWFTTFSYLGVIRNIWILAEGLQKYLWRCNLFSVLMNIALNWILIPIWGAAGAAIASVISQIFNNVVFGFIIAPIRPNNALMIEALHPKNLVLYTKKIVDSVAGRLGKKRRIL